VRHAAGSVDNLCTTGGGDCSRQRVLSVATCVDSVHRVWTTSRGRRVSRVTTRGSVVGLAAAPVVDAGRRPPTNRGPVDRELAGLAIVAILGWTAVGPSGPPIAIGRGTMARSFKLVAHAVSPTIVAILLCSCTGTSLETAPNETSPHATATVSSRFSQSSSASSAPTSTSAKASSRPGPDDSIDGATQFVWSVVDAINKAHREPNSRILELFFDEGCLGCGDILKQVRGLEGAKRRIAIDAWSVISAVSDTWEKGSATVALVLRQQHVDIVDENGTKVDYYKATEAQFFLTLTYVNNHWQVKRWQKM
jgi:hypothetical protein